MSTQKTHLSNFSMNLVENNQVSIKYSKGLACETSFELTMFAANILNVKHFRELPEHLQCKRCLAKLKSKIADLKN
jgi:hypothetical protein